MVIEVTRGSSQKISYEDIAKALRLNPRLRTQVAKLLVGKYTKDVVGLVQVVPKKKG